MNYFQTRDARYVRELNFSELSLQDLKTPLSPRFPDKENIHIVYPISFHELEFKAIIKFVVIIIKSL